MGANDAGGHDGAATSGPHVVVRTATPSDARPAAHLHATRISQGFLSSLGEGFLVRLYRRISVAPGSFLLVAVDPGAPQASHGGEHETDRGDVAGFIAGSSDVGALYRSFLLHDGVMAGLSAAPRLVRNWRRVLETLRHGAEDGAGVGRGPELLAVAVDPAASGRGIGTALVAAFLAEVTSAGDTAAHVVVGADNNRAIALYRSAGFIMGDTFELHAGTTSLLMQWDAPSGPSAQDKVGNR